MIFITETIEAIITTGTNSTIISQIVEINEIEKYWFLYLQTLDKAFIIPKEKLQNLDKTGNAIKRNRNTIQHKIQCRFEVEMEVIE